MKSIHLVITDLFLPKGFAADVCAGLHLPALEKMLARGRSDALQEAGLEKLLCGLFGVLHQQAAPIAPISALFDGLGEGCWLRADPVHLRLQRDQLVLLPDVEISTDEAGQLCAALNEHFAGQGMEFFAPHPQRWYVRLDRLPDIETVLLSQAAGRNVHGLLPKGAEALRWHRLFNEVQMLLFAHPVNDAREARGDLAINSLWFWGGGCSSVAALQKAYDSVSSNEVLAEMFASAAGIPFEGWSGRWRDALSLTLMERLAIRLGCQNTSAKSLVISHRERGFLSEGKQLLVWTGLRLAMQQGDLGAWRAALQDFETGYAQPLWQALRAGKIAQLKIEILSGENSRCLLLSRADAWAFWRRPRPMPDCSLL